MVQIVNQQKAGKIDIPLTESESIVMLSLLSLGDKKAMNSSDVVFGQNIIYIPKLSFSSSKFYSTALDFAEIEQFNSSYF